MDLKKVVGEKIKKQRQYKNKTQKEFAVENSIRIATLTDMENGKMNFKIETLEKIVEALDCELKIDIKPLKK